MRLKFRLIRQEREDSIAAVRSGVSSWYILQYKENTAEPWETVPVVMLDSLPQEEQQAIYKELMK